MFDVVLISTSGSYAQSLHRNYALVKGQFELPHLFALLLFFWD